MTLSQSIVLKMKGLSYGAKLLFKQLEYSEEVATQGDGVFDYTKVLNYRENHLLDSIGMPVEDFDAFMSELSLRGICRIDPLSARLEVWNFLESRWGSPAYERQAGLDSYHQERASIEASRNSEIYFLERPKENLVKIGRSRNVKKRIQALRSHFPGESLCLLGTEPGGKARERELHEKFKEFRVMGEWFSLAQNIQSYTETLRKI